MNAPNSVLIVGGGTAGWMTACLLATHWNTTRITLVESDTIGTIGVGEGSTPYLKQFFKQLGIPESEWMPACDATYKVGIQFNDWTNKAEFPGYFHPFFTPFDLEPGKAFFAQINQRRMHMPGNAQPENYFLAAALARQGKVPVTDRFSGDMDYAYHFDAGKLGDLLKRHAMALGVTHRIDDIEQVEGDANQIASVIGKQHGTFTANLYVDCSGFRGIIVKQTQKRPFVSYSDTLFNDAAVAIQTPVIDGFKPQTESQALSSGWMWRIPLTSRTGNGYVYSTAYCSPQQAEQELRDALGIDESVQARHLKMQVGRLDSHWQGNCIAIGLAQGFIEPLEATALMLVQYAIQQLIDTYDTNNLAEQQTVYNAEINRMFDGVRDYIAAHYYLNTRDDTPYWRDCRTHMNVPEVLKSLVEVWQSDGDFDTTLRHYRDKLVYLTPSWYCILAGMGILPPDGKAIEPEPIIDAYFKQIISRYF